MPQNEYLECGKMINTHGIRGDIKLESYCDSPEILKNLRRVFLKEQESYRLFRVCRASVQKGFVLMHLEGLDDIDAAIPLKNRVFYALRSDLPLKEGAHFVADLIGLPVIDAETGEEYGILTDVSNCGASDLYLIRTDKGEKMMPAVREFVDRIDLDTGIYVRPIPGMFD